MGVDITMSIIRGNEYIKENIFDGRNSEWFNNLEGRGWDDEYDHLLTDYGIPDEVPNKIKDHFDNKIDYGYYDFHYITVFEFKKWFKTYRPDLKAGWVSTYDKWKWEHKHIAPKDPKHYLDEDDDLRDIHFIEYDDKYECSGWLYDYLIDNKKEIEDTDIIIYYFDA